MRLRITTIGGGTGHFSLLSGLKEHPVDLTAIVSMADSGGSSGVLRDELGVLPPGDVRQCLIALSESPVIMRQLMTYRFDLGSLRGHSFGNLFLSALEKMTGSHELAITEATKILSVRGSIIPVTLNHAHLVAKLNDNRMLMGEHAISDSMSITTTGIRSLSFRPTVKANPRAIKAIMHSDCVIIGPGNHFSSIVPNLIIPGIARVLNKTRATVIYICNVTNKKGQTDGYSPSKYLADLERLTAVTNIDVVLINEQVPIRRLYEKYQRKEGRGFLVAKGPIPKHRARRYEYRSLLNQQSFRAQRGDSLASQRAFIRHDSAKLAKAIIEIATRM